MVKTRKGYQRTGYNFRQSGFKDDDTYEQVLRKAATPLLQSKVDYENCHLIMSNARVVNLPLQSGKAWTLGGYLRELGGSKRRIIGVYIPNHVSSINLCDAFI